MTGEILIVEIVVWMLDAKSDAASLYRVDGSMV